MQKVTREQLIAKASELLANGTVGSVLGWGAGEFGYDVTPTLFQNADELKAGYTFDFTEGNLMNTGVDAYAATAMLPEKAKKITIASQYFLSLGIPYEELFVRILHGIKLIQIHGQSGSPSGSAESNLTKTSQLADNIWRILPRNNINLIATLICCPEFLLGSQL